MNTEGEQSEREEFLQTLPPQVNWDPTRPEGLRVVANDRDRERVKSIADLDSRPLSDEARMEIDALGNERGIIETFSSDTLEEDLANMELTGRYALPEKMRNETIKSAVTKVLQELGPYIPQEKLNLLFPGLDLASVEGYDLSNSRIRFHILPDDDYKVLHQTLNGGKGTSGSGGFTPVGISPAVYPLADTITAVNMGEKRPIIVAEGDPTNSYIGPIPAKDEIVQQLKRDLEAKLIHELLHNFDVGEGLPKKMKEGVVEWYTQGIVAGDITDENYYEKPKVPLAYFRETEAVSLLLTALIDSKMVDIDTVDKALVSGDKTARIQLAGSITKRYSLEEAERILTWGYRSGRQALAHIVGLEARQDSQLGEFLRTFGDKDLVGK